MNEPTYRKLLEEMWGDGLIETSELKALAQLQRELGVDVDVAARIEREVMGVTKEEAFVVGMGTAGTDAGTGQGAGAGPGTLSGAATQAGGSPMPRSSVVEPGMLLRDRYEVEAEVGRGGMGQVLRVMDRTMGERRALKVLAPEHLGRPDLLERMRREVRVSQRLRHPGIVQVFDYDEDPASGLAFFTMEFVEGQTLRRWMGGRKGAGAALEDVERISAALISAIGYAHGEGVVHLDLKPDNVMVTDDLSKVRVLDFGISRALDVEGLQTMLTGAGTPYYMAPEQEAGARDVGPAADVYSLGAILYELLVGAPPRGAFRAPADLRPEVGRLASDLVMAALRPGPGERPEAAALALSFAAAAASEQEQEGAGTLGDFERLYRSRSEEQQEELRRAQAPSQFDRWLEQASAGSAFFQSLVAVCLDEGRGTPADRSGALHWYRMAAEQGEASAQENLGYAYYYGEGVQEDKEEAVRWIRMAAEQGSASAQNTLGHCYQHGEGVREDKEEGVRWYRMAAEQGNASAQNSLGYAYDYGEGVQEDKEEGVRWYRMAAEQGKASAQYYLGYAYAYGEGVQEDKEEGVRWYRMAAEQGIASAQDCLGDAYSDGEGVREDKEEGVRWYRMAAEQGNACAQNSLGYAYYYGEGVQEDKEEGVRWYRMAAEQGNASAQYNLGYAYAYGEGVQGDKEEGVRWYRMAAEQGNASAQNSLGLAYYRGEGAPQDYEKSAEWLKAAAAQGNKGAQWNLGLAYEAGEGLPVDADKARYWIELSAEQGYEDAVEWVAERGGGPVGSDRAQEEGGPEGEEEGWSDWQGYLLLFAILVGALAPVALLAGSGVKGMLTLSAVAAVLSSIVFYDDEPLGVGAFMGASSIGLSGIVYALWFWVF